MNSPNVTTVPLPPAKGRSIGRIRADQALGACPARLSTASKLGKIRGPQMGRIHRPLRQTIVEDLRAAKMHTAADLVERSVSETLTYYAFPDIHWQKIRTSNPLERIMKEIRRRTRVVGAFPDGQSCLNLAAARLRYIAGTAWSDKCNMNMRPLYQPQVPQTGAVALLSIAWGNRVCQFQPGPID